MLPRVYPASCLPRSLPKNRGLLCIRVMTNTTSALALALTLLVTADSFAAGLPARLTVLAGDTERIETVVEFALSEGTGKTMGLRDPQGRTIPLQVDNAGRARFVLRDLPRNETRTYQIVETAPNSTGADAVSVKRVGTKLEVTRADKLIFAYQAEPSKVPSPSIAALYRRGGYIHPILSPAGKLVTDDYPPDHRHHHGIWFPWTHTEIEGVAHDFWNVQDRTGNVEFAGIDRTWSGPVDGGFLSRQRHVAITGTQSNTALNETWEVRAYNTGQSSHPMWIFDFVSIQENALTVPITLPQYYYGGLGFRGSAEWRGTNQQPYLTSEGIADKIKGNETRGRWCFWPRTRGGTRTS